MEKKCTKCDIIMDVSNFYTDVRNKNGIRSICKLCFRKNIPPTHKFCLACGVKKEYSLFSRRNDNCKDCYNEYRKVKKSENSKKIYNTVIDHIYISSKICTKCNIEKEIDLFPLRKESKDGHRNQCIECFTYNMSIAKKLYRQRNKKSLRQKDISYRKSRMKSDPFYRAKIDARNIIRKALSEGGYSKKSRTQEILGCSFIKFKEHIESLFLPNMNWDNRNEWHIDHIIPLSFVKNESELLIINHFTNLRPLWIIDNQIKSDSVDLKNDIYEKIIELREFSYF